MSDIKHLLFADSHEWILVEDDIATVGISNHAQNLLGDLVYVELPQIGQVVNNGDEISVVESVKSASDIYSPVSGKIISTNEDVENNPKIINEDPYENGWIFKIQIDNNNDLENLMNYEKYHSLIEE